MEDWVIGAENEPLDENLDFTEFDKLVKLVEEAGWNHKVQTLHGGKQIVLYNKGNRMLDDAVIHPFSNGNKAGLMETYVLNDCRGWERAEEIFEGWKKEGWAL